VWRRKFYLAGRRAGGGVSCVVEGWNGIYCRCGHVEMMNGECMPTISFKSCVLAAMGGGPDALLLCPCS
jgi:hypothetical protein